MQLLEGAEKPTEKDVFDVIQDLLSGSYPTHKIELRSGDGVRIGLISKTSDFDLEDAILGKIKTGPSPFSKKITTHPPGRVGDSLSGRFNTHEIKFENSPVFDERSVFVVISNKGKGASTAVETAQVKALSGSIEGGIRIKTSKAGAFMYVNRIEQIRGTQKADARLYNDSDPPESGVFLSLKDSEHQQWSGVLGKEIYNIAKVAKFVEAVISNSVISSSSGTLSVTVPTGGFSMKLNTEDETDLQLAKLAMFGSDVIKNPAKFGLNNCNMIFKGRVGDIKLVDLDPPKEGHKQLPPKETIYFDDEEKIKSQKMCLHVRKASRPQDGIKVPPEWQRPDGPLVGITRILGVRFFVMPEDKADGAELVINNDNTITKSARLKPTRQTSESSAMAGVAISGVQVPPGRSPAGKPASSESKSKNKILSNNAKVQGQSWGNAKPLKLVKPINETRDLLEHLFEE